MKGAAPPSSCGIGWRHAHERELLERQPSLPFIEVHSENYFGDGGAPRALLAAARETYEISLHGVGLSLGSAEGLDAWHLDRLAALVRQFDPVRVSDHASFARATRFMGQTPLHASDLLPVAFTHESLALLAANVQRVQDRLKRPIGIENISACLGWVDDTLAEAEFFNLLARRTGCWLLVDVNNLVVNALNADAPDPAAAACAFVDAIEPRHVGQIHIAGYSQHDGLVIDDHGSRVHAPVWEVYTHALRRFGPRPTLLEWDTDLPTLDVLLDEARRAAAVARAALHPDSTGSAP
jgi:uncharacterized protein (UPF0276 family)